VDLASNGPFPTTRDISGIYLELQNCSEDPATLHAGLLMTSVVKFGMSIWMGQEPLSGELKGTDEQYR
jgi:hypothetical protein